MSDTNRANDRVLEMEASPASARMRQRGRLRRLYDWLRERDDSPRAREHFANAGIWSSRVYALIVLLTVSAAAVLTTRDTPIGLLYMLCAIWALISRVYLWYQGKAVLAYPVIEEGHANRDMINSMFVPVALALLFAAWAITNVISWFDGATYALSYGFFGWYVWLMAFHDTVYDLRINGRATLVLAKVPGRQEFDTRAPTRT